MLLSATFFLYVEAFLLRFSCGKVFFPPFEGLSATFWLAQPPTIISAGAHACVSFSRYIKNSNKVLLDLHFCLANNL